MMFKKGDKIANYTVAFPHKQSFYAETYRVKDSAGKTRFLKLINFNKLNRHQINDDGQVVEIERIWAAGHVIIFDVDVKGGVNLKKYFGDAALSVFIQAPSVESLRERLVKRGTDSPEAIEERVAKAAEEMTYAPEFDYVLVNDDLRTAFAESEKVVEDFLDDGKLNYSVFI